MPYKEKLTIEKRYHSIGEVAEHLKVATSLIRFWETEFPTLVPKKSRKGNRQYLKKDFDMVCRIYDIVKVKGHTLKSARRILSGELFEWTDELVILFGQSIIEKPPLMSHEVAERLESFKSQN